MIGTVIGNHFVLKIVKLCVPYQRLWQSKVNKSTAKIITNKLLTNDLCGFKLLVSVVSRALRGHKVFFSLLHLSALL